MTSGSELDVMAPVWTNALPAAEQDVRARALEMHKHTVWPSARSAAVRIGNGELDDARVAA